MGAKVPYIKGWRCYEPGDLNPHLVSFDYSDILNNPLTSYSSNPMSSIGEALNRAIRPDTTRGTKSSSVKAVVLGGYVVQGREALSYNMKVDYAGALANRVQILYIRVPELSSLPDPYCKDNACTIEQASVVVEMHPTAVLPNFISSQPSIIAGSIVEVEFSEVFSRAIVTKILEEATNFEMVYSSISGKEAFSASGNGTFFKVPAEGDPGNCPWSDGAQALETVWQSKVPAYSQWNGTKMRNGYLQETGMLVSAHGARLVPPAAEDFKKLVAAFNLKFDGVTLSATGYRTYEKQVEVRMERSTGADNQCGEGAFNAAGKELGIAAIPGTSNHGWGAAVDLVRTKWEHGNVKGKKGGTSKHFQWVNKFSKDYNFVFGVRGEWWHLDWMPFSKQTTGWSGMKQTIQTTWNDIGQDDENITKT